MPEPLPMLEADLQSQVLQTARILGCLSYHTHDSRRSTSGFPDLVIVHPGTGGLLFAELKRDGQDPTVPQRRWLDALGVRHIAVVWRPADLRSGLIARQLQQIARRTS
jgi:VRR-NUC domain-containing protein